MPNRTARFASAVFAGFLLATSLTVSGRAAAAASDSVAGAASNDAAGAVPDGAAVAASDSAADECLSSPKDQTPQGSHWYYRIDRATKRQCWYLRAEGEKLSKVTPPNSSVSASSSASARPTSPRSEPAVQRTMADARAELPQRTGFEQPNREARPALAKSPGAAVSEINRYTKAPVAETQPSVVASRWAGQVDADSATSPAPPASPAPNKAYAATNVSPASPPQLLSPAVAGQFTAADVPPETPTHSVQMLLAAIMGALVLAAIMGRLIFKIVGMRRRARRRLRGRRGAIWKSAPSGRKKSLAYPATGTLPRRPDFPRDLDQVGDPDDRIVELLRDLSRKRRKGPNRGQFGVGSFL
jgi:hypothetical protein